MSYRNPPLTVRRGDTFHSSLKKTPNDGWLMLRSVEPNERPAVSKRPSRSATSESTLSNVPPLAVRLVRARFLRLWFFPRSQLPPIFIVCSPRVCVSDDETLHDEGGLVEIGYPPTPPM